MEIKLSLELCEDCLSTWHSCSLLKSAKRDTNEIVKANKSHSALLKNFKKPCEITVDYILILILSQKHPDRCQASISRTSTEE